MTLPLIIMLAVVVLSAVWCILYEYNDISWDDLLAGAFALGVWHARAPTLTFSQREEVRK